jgi:hypothetical protein
MRTSFGERLLDLAVSGFLWGFRILIVAVILIGTIVTIRAGKYTGEQWIDFVAFISQAFTPDRRLYNGLRYPAHDQFAHGDIL